MLIKPKSWERHGLKPWIEAAKKRLRIATCWRLRSPTSWPRIAWSVSGPRPELREQGRILTQPPKLSLIVQREMNTRKMRSPR